MHQHGWFCSDLLFFFLINRENYTLFNGVLIFEDWTSIMWVKLLQIMHFFSDFGALMGVYFYTNGGSYSGNKNPIDEKQLCSVFPKWPNSKKLILRKIYVNLRPPIHAFSSLTYTLLRWVTLYTRVVWDSRESTMYVSHSSYTHLAKILANIFMQTLRR